MHELTFTKEILKIILEAAQINGVEKISHIYLTASPLSDIKETWINRYFRIIAKGTPAAGAGIHLAVEPFKAICRGCGNEFSFSPPLKARPACPLCGSHSNTLLSKPGITINHMEAI